MTSFSVFNTFKPSLSTWHGKFDKKYQMRRFYLILYQTRDVPDNALILRNIYLVETILDQKLIRQIPQNTCTRLRCEIRQYRR